MRKEGGPLPVDANRRAVVFTGHGPQRVTRQPAIGTGVELRGADIFAKRLDRRASPRIVQPAEPRGVDRDCVEQCYGAILAGGVRQRNIQALAFPAERGTLVTSSLSPSPSCSIRTKSEPAATSRTWKPSRAGPWGMTGTPSNRQAPAGVRTTCSSGLRNQALPAVPAQQHAETHPLHGLLGQHDHLAAMPVVRAGTEARHLPPQGSVVGIDQIQVQRVVTVRRAGHPLGLALTDGNDGLGVGLVQLHRLRHTTGALAWVPLSQTNQVSWNSKPFPKGPQPGDAQGFPCLARSEDRLGHDGCCGQCLPLGGTRNLLNRIVNLATALPLESAGGDGQLCA